MRLPSLWLAVPVCFWTLGCFAEGYSMKDRVTEAARKYNEGVQWSKLDQAVGYLPKDERKPFLERMTALEDEFEFADSEMVGLDVDKKHDRATARMSYSWTMKRHGLVEKTTTEQTWSERDGKWVMIHEVRLRGAPSPLWKERAEVEDDTPTDGKSAKKDKIVGEEGEEREHQGATAGGPGPSWKK